MDSGVEDDDISLSEGSMDEKVFAKWDNQWKHCKNYFWKINLNFAVILI